MNEPLRLLAGFALTASAAVALALLLSHLLRPQASARSAYIAWVMVLLAALIPFRPFASSTAVTIAPPHAAQTVMQATAQPGNVEKSQIAASSAVPAPPAGEPRAPKAPASFPAPVGTIRTLTVEQIVLILYLLGMTMSLALQTVRHIRYMRLVRRWRAAPLGSTQEAYDLVCREMGIARAPHLYVCRAVDTPLLAGVLHPCVLLPDENLNPPELHLIFRHELTHFRRGDLWIKLLTLLAVGLHWYNPLIYLMRREIEFACEASCDESVVRGCDLDARAYYSETIVAVIRRQTRRRTALATTFYGGKKGMKNRILSIMNMQRRRLGALILLPVMIFTLLFSVALATEPASTHPPQEATEASLASLFDEAGEIMTPAEAEYAAVRFYCDVREMGGQMDRPYTVSNYVVKNVTFGTETFETAVVDLDITFNYGDEDSHSTFRAYLTPRGGTPLALTLADDWGETASAYYTHPLLSSNDASQRLEDSLPRQAIINSPISAAGNLCSMTTDYDWPMGTYFNGMEVTVDELSIMGNNAPMLTDARMIYWAHVTISPGEDNGGAQGWIPLSALTFADEIIGEVPSLPQGTVTTAAATGYANLYAGCDLSGRVLTTVRKGERVTLLGRFLAFYHVRLQNGACGFMPLENVALDEVARALADSVIPANYDTTQPGQVVKYDEYMEYIANFYDLHGDNNEWDLETRAQLAAYKMNYPFDSLTWIDIIPGENDLPEEQALALAKDYIHEHFNVEEKDILHILRYFFYYPEDPDAHVWYFRFGTRAGMRDCGVYLDQQGNAIKDFLADYVNRAEDPQPVPGKDTIDYYKQYSAVQEVEEDTQNLKGRAWELYQQANPDAGAQENYVLTLVKCADKASQDYMPEGWYRVTVHPIYREAENFTYLDYEVYFVGEQFFADDVQEYRDRLAEMKALDAIRNLEAQMGPFYTWSYEDKAKYAPELGWDSEYALPAEGDITEQQAIGLAQRALAERGLLPLNALVNDYEYYTSYTMLYPDGQLDGAMWAWRIDFYDHATLDAAQHGIGALDGYIVWLNPATGEVADIWCPGGNG